MYHNELSGVKRSRKFASTWGKVSQVEQRRTTKQRVDAALAYGELSQIELTERIKMSRSTLNRRRREEGHTFGEGELYEIAQKCGVPLWFLERGWEGWRDEIKSPEDLEALAGELFPDGPPSS